MSLYAPLFRHVLWPLYEGGLMRRRTLQYLREYERQQWQSPEEIEARQWQGLQALIRHCWEHVPFYRTWWGDACACSACTKPDFGGQSPQTSRNGSRADASSASAGAPNTCCFISTMAAR